VFTAGFLVPLPLLPFLALLLDEPAPFQLVDFLLFVFSYGKFSQLTEGVYFMTKRRTNPDDSFRRESAETRQKEHSQLDTRASPAFWTVVVLCITKSGRRLRVYSRVVGP